MEDNLNTVSNAPSRTSRLPKAAKLAATGTSAAPATVSAALAIHGSIALAITSAFLLPILIIVLVICPAIWSRKSERRKAALDVIDRLLGRWPANAIESVPDRPGRGQPDALATTTDLAQHRQRHRPRPSATRKPS